MDTLVKSKIETLSSMPIDQTQKIYDTIFFKILRSTDETTYAINDNGAFVQLNKLPKKMLKDLNSYLDNCIENLNKEKENTLLDLDSLEQFYERKKKKANTPVVVKYPHCRNINIPYADIDIAKIKVTGVKADILRNIRRIKNINHTNNTASSNCPNLKKSAKKGEKGEEDDEADEAEDEVEEEELDEEDEAEEEEEEEEEDDEFATIGKKSEEEAEEEDDDDDEDEDFDYTEDIEDDLIIEEEEDDTNISSSKTNGNKGYKMNVVGYSYTTFEEDCTIVWEAKHN